MRSKTSIRLSKTLRNNSHSQISLEVLTVFFCFDKFGEGKSIAKTSTRRLQGVLEVFYLLLYYRYTADERGYRADIVTNELGTESKNPADVTIQSSALTGEQAAIQYTQEYQRQILQQQQQAANYAQQQAANYAQQRVASYNSRASARQSQPAYTPAAPYTAPAPASTPRVAAPAYVPVSPVSGRLSAPSVTTEASLQGDHNAGYNDATAVGVVDVTPLRPAVEQVPQRTTSDGSSKRRNKQTYG